MGWETVDANDASSLQPKPVPNGTYTLQLTGAYDNKFRAGAIDVAFLIADENSEFRGRKLYLDLPNPDEQPWAAGVYTRIVKALGAKVTPYADPKEELGKIAQNGHSRLTADVFIEHFTRNDGSEGSKNKINSRSLRPAA